VASRRCAHALILEDDVATGTETFAAKAIAKGTARAGGGTTRATTKPSARATKATK
jgi:hypothetical protein